MYPVTLNLSGRRCLVVGGGAVALRKVEGLLFEGAKVTVVSLRPIPPIMDLSSRAVIGLESRGYWPGEASGYSLVYAATDDRKANRKVFEDAKASGVWVNVADDPQLCTFHLPARLLRGTLQLAVSTAGEAPFAARRLRELFERRFGPEWGEWVKAAARFRKTVRGVRRSEEEEARLFDRFFRSTVDAKRLTARVPAAAEEVAWLSGTGRKKKPGLVSLVGAGPGDAGLLTLRGRQRLLQADAVVFDRLSEAAMPGDLPRRVELYSVGKQAGLHPVPQEEINALLLRLAREGKRVVRLKGGDPYVFGRGGEEVLALLEANLPFEVVPGVTAAIAVPAYAGIPVTHRGEAVQVTLVTAHESEKQSGPQVRWDLLAQDRHQTLVGYMGVAALPEVVKKLLAAGMDPDTPAAMVERGATPGQRTVRSTLSNLTADAQRADLRPPSIFIIGPGVRHAENLNWFTTRPLFGERVLIAAPAGEFGEALEKNGAVTVEVPLPLTPAAQVLIGAHPLTGCILRSADEASIVFEESRTPGFGPEVIAWCLGKETAHRARKLGFLRVKEIESPAGAADLIARLKQHRRARNTYTKPSMRSMRQ
jgi:uroporphyrin-III C-methyltransferase/precorrin-2 dehydrogenase/sirohydrochlorin ferrochelatase